MTMLLALFCVGLGVALHMAHGRIDDLIGALADERRERRLVDQLVEDLRAELAEMTVERDAARSSALYEAACERDARSLATPSAALRSEDG